MRSGKWLVAGVFVLALAAPSVAQAQPNVFGSNLPPAQPSFSTVINPSQSLLDYILPGSSLLNFFPRFNSNGPRAISGPSVMSPQAGRQYMSAFGLQRPFAPQQRFFLWPF